MLLAIITVAGITCKTSASASFRAFSDSKPSESPSNVKILVYHSIAPDSHKKEAGTNLSLKNHYRVLPETFESQMRYLKDNGYTTITLGVLIADINAEKKISGKEVVLTFDDGWKNQYTYAVPILEKYGFTATFGIISNNVGSATEAKSKMTWGQIEDLHMKGFEIASHTENHPFLNKLSDKQLQSELIGSKKTLESKLGVIIPTFIYPYYDYDIRVMNAVRDAGYTGARGGYHSFNNTIRHIYELRAQEVIENPNPFVTKER